MLDRKCRRTESEAGQVGTEVGRAGQEGCRIYRTEGVEHEGCRTGRKQEQRDADKGCGTGGCRTGGMQDRRNAGQDGCIEQGRSRTRKHFTVTNLPKKRCYFDGVSFSLASFTFLNTVSFYICCSVKNV